MNDLIKLEMVDVDGAVREAAEAAGDGRRDFLRKTGIGAGAFVAGGVLFSGVAEAQSISSRRPSRANDVRILNYALTLEYLEAAFYREALQGNALTDPAVRNFATVAGAHETAHVRALRAVLGGRAVRSPRFDFGETTSNQDQFKATAQAVEDLGVSAYAGQGPNIRQRAVVQAALSIHSVEARHAAWIRVINNGPTAAGTRAPAPQAFDPARSQRVVLAAVGDTKFIQS
jgi:hypothetical protein